MDFSRRDRWGVQITADGLTSAHALPLQPLSLPMIRPASLGRRSVIGKTLADSPKEGDLPVSVSGEGPGHAQPLTLAPSLRVVMNAFEKIENCGYLIRVLPLICSLTVLSDVHACARRNFRE